MSSDKTVSKARRAVRLLPTHPTPAAHTHASGTALEHTLREHPGRQLTPCGKGLARLI